MASINTGSDKTRAAPLPVEVFVVLGACGHFDTEIHWLTSVHATRASADRRADALNALAAVIVDAEDREAAMARLHAADPHHAAFPLAPEDTETTYERLIEPGSLYTVEARPLEPELPRADGRAMP